jgi:glycerol-1-phosphate dehydrogenase [NAD(P)+]
VIGAPATATATASRPVTVPRVLQVEGGALSGLATVLGEAFDTRCTAVVTGTQTSLALAHRLAGELRGTGASVGVHPTAAGTLAATAALVDAFDHDPVTLLVAVGGGRAIDVAKLAAARLGVPLIVVPTILASDGICSPVVTLTGADGQRRSLGAAMPAGVVIDLDVVGRAPLRYLRAGLGDLASNITAVHDWRRAALGGEPYDELAASMALMGAQSALDVAWPPGPEDLHVIARGLVMSGLAMEVAGSSRPCSGAEHLISHALDQLRGPAAGLHGEHVALGVHLATALQGAPGRERVGALLGRIGLPPVLATWGIDAATVVDALALAPSTRPGRVTVLDELPPDRAELAALVAATFSMERSS